MRNVIILSIKTTPSSGIALLFEVIAYLIPGTITDVFEYDEWRTVFCDPFEHALEGPA